MSATAATTDKASPKASSELEQVMKDLGAIREDFASLAASTTKLAAGQAKKQVHRVGDLAESAVEKASTYRDILTDKVKEHPLAAVGIAVAAGLVLSSLRKR